MMTCQGAMCPLAFHVSTVGTEGGGNVGFPKIPDPQEIANLTAEAMSPMMLLLTEIRDLIEEQNKLLQGREVA